MVVGVLAAACATPRIGLWQIAEEAERNEVAAARMASKKIVELEAIVDDVSFLKENRTVTSGATQYGTRSSRSMGTTRTVTVQSPYALLRTVDDTWVTCFLAADPRADLLAKGERASLQGAFSGFERVGDRRRVVLTNCFVTGVNGAPVSPH
jgi:hypothetical protein